jgi:hypothetical protein
MEPKNMKRQVLRKYDSELARVCMCQHIAADHVGVYQGTRTACIRAIEIDEDGKASWCQCFNFKLDNLSYIEDLARERKLI